jgi:carotenoid cleavage dioxygenase-like enzyme
MATPYPNDPLLRGPFEPIRFEADCADLVVDGELPADLAGTLYRIGPNPQDAPRGRYNPLQGDGMVHAFRIDGGRVAYRNRWVRTQQWTLERAAGRALFATSGDPRDADPSVVGQPTDGAANTHVVWHAGRLLALEEGHGPIELDAASLDTHGRYTFDAALPRNMTAHPKIDPETGEMVFFANFPTRAFDGALAYYIADANGAIVFQATIAGPFCALVHDFAITRTHVVFVVCPVTLSLERLRRGGSPIAWEPGLGTHVGVFPRRAPERIRWHRGSACMAWHTLNAFDDGECVVVDLCRQDAPAFPAADGTPNPEPALRQYLERWTLDPATDTVATARLSDIVCEYPRIDERRAGLAYRYGYFAAVGGPGTGDPCQRAIARFDHATATMQTYHAGARCAVSEPVFVARRAAATEDDGYLLATIYDEVRNASHLAVFDARDVTAGPVARALLDHRVPMGFHGSWCDTNL